MVDRPECFHYWIDEEFVVVSIDGQLQELI
jgi:hypothetical protein